MGSPVLSWEGVQGKEAVEGKEGRALPEWNGTNSGGGKEWSSGQRQRPTLASQGARFTPDLSPESGLQGEIPTLPGHGS